MRRIFSLAIILFIVVVLSTTLFACKEDNREYKTEINSNDIAKLSLFSFDGNGEEQLGLANLGHAFLSLENISDNNIKLLDRTITPGETIAIGSWSILEHFGVWYNVESNYITNHGKYDGRVSITIGIDNDNLNTLEEFINNHDRWNPIFNCSKFALSLWNTVASDSEYLDKPLIYTPTYVANEIKKFDNYELNKAIITDENMGYFTDSQNASFVMEGGNYASV